MLKIRSQQLEALEEQAEDGLIDYIVSVLDEDHPETIEGMPDDMVYELVENGLDRARSHDLEQDNSLTAFVCMMFVVAPNFDQHPRIKAILADETLEPDERFEKVLDEISDEEWDEAENNWDADAWFPNK